MAFRDVGAKGGSMIEAFDKEWRHGDRNKAKGMAVAYVNAHREELARALGRLSLVELVHLVSDLRSQGKDRARVIVDMWLLNEFEPQKIGGSVNVPQRRGNGRQ